MFTASLVLYDSSMETMKFNARLVKGSGRGKLIGTPTLNMDLNDVPADVVEGIYAGWANVDGIWHKAAIHYGPRPVFQDSTSFEAYLLDTIIDVAPERIEIALIERLRDVMDFPSKDDLLTQIKADVEQTRAILSAHGSPDASTASPE